MRICDLAQFHSPLGGGVKRYLSDKQHYLAAIPGAHHILIVPSHRDAVTRASTASIYEIKSPRLPGSRSYRMMLSKERIMHAVADARPDLIEVGDPYRTAWIGLQAGRKHNVPVLAYYHSDFPRAIGRTVRRFLGDRLERLVSGPVEKYLVRLYNRMDATVVSSRRLSDILESSGVQRLVHIPLGTDVRTFFPRPSRDRIRTELGLAPGTRLLLFVGRMAREKNIRNLIESLSLLPPEAPPCHLLLVGDGELHDYVAREAAERPNLTWLPYSESAQRLADFYSAADLFVHAGKYETFGIVALEAQACGTPVLVVREGGVEDAVEGEEPPLFARGGSAAALAAAVHHFLRVGDTPEKRAARRERIVQRFSIDGTFERMIDLYRHLIARRPIAELSHARYSHHELSRSPLPKH